MYLVEEKKKKKGEAWVIFYLDPLESFFLKIERKLLGDFDLFIIGKDWTPNLLFQLSEILPVELTRSDFFFLDMIFIF